MQLKHIRHRSWMVKNVRLVLISAVGSGVGDPFGTWIPVPVYSVLVGIDLCRERPRDESTSIPRVLPTV
jgi:hypothetical protein